MNNIPVPELVRALQILLKYNPEAAISVRLRHLDVYLLGGRYTGHRMTKEEVDEMNRLGWFPCARTEEGNEDAGSWEMYL